MFGPLGHIPPNLQGIGDSHSYVGSPRMSDQDWRGTRDPLMFARGGGSVLGLPVLGHVHGFEYGYVECGRDMVGGGKLEAVCK